LFDAVVQGRPRDEPSNVRVVEQPTDPQYSHVVERRPAEPGSLAPDRAQRRLGRDAAHDDDVLGPELADAMRVRE
jgi:hypothetical protein